VKDRSYRATPLGLEVARYYRWKKHEWGATAETLRDYEAILARLALYCADLELQDLAPPVGQERLRECWEHYWGDAAPRTRAKVRSVWVDFFDWAVRERDLAGNPARILARPKARQSDRTTFEADDVLRLIAAQPRLRDRVALHLLFRLGLRKNELALVQYKHFRHDRKRLTVFGKGGTVAPVPVPDDLRLMLADLITSEQPQPSEFLLSPSVKAGLTASCASFGRTGESACRPRRSTAGGTPG
jgi:site-specific recombinase XerC